MAYGDGGYYFLQPVNNGYGGIGYGLSPLPPGTSEGPHMSEAGNCPLYFKWKRLARKYNQAAVRLRKAGKAKKSRVFAAKALAAMRTANAERQKCHTGLHSHGPSFGRVADMFMGQGVSKQVEPYPTSMIEKKADIRQLHGSLKALKNKSRQLAMQAQRQQRTVHLLKSKAAQATSATSKSKLVRLLEAEHYALKRLQVRQKQMLMRIQKQKGHIEMADRREIHMDITSPDPVGDAQGERMLLDALSKGVLNTPPYWVNPAPAAPAIDITDEKGLTPSMFDAPKFPSNVPYYPPYPMPSYEHGDPNAPEGVKEIWENQQAEEIIAEPEPEPEIELSEEDIVSDASDPAAPSFYEEHKQLISIGAGALGLVALIKLMKD